MNVETVVYLKDENFIPDFVRVSSDTAGCTVYFHNDESEGTTCMLRCKRMFETSDYNIKSGESVQICFPSTGRFEITNPCNGLMKCIVEVVESTALPSTEPSSFGSSRPSFPNLCDVHCNYDDDDDSFESSSEEDEKKGVEGEDCRGGIKDGEEWLGVTYHLDKARPTASAGTTPSLDELFEHEDMQGLLSVRGKPGANSRREESDATSMLAKKRSAWRGQKASSNLKKESRKLRRKTISDKIHKRTGRESSTDDSCSDVSQSSANDDDDDDDDFYLQRARMRQAAETQSSKFELEARVLRDRRDALAEEGSSECSGNDDDEDFDQSGDGRLVMTSVTEPTSVTMMSTANTPIFASSSLDRRAQPSPLRQQRFFAPPPVSSTSYHYTTFTSQSSPARRQKEMQAYTSYINPYETASSGPSRRAGISPGFPRSASGSKLHAYTSTLSSSGGGGSGSVGRGGRRSRRSKLKYSYDIVTNQLYSSPSTNNLLAPPSALHSSRIPDIEVVIISDYDFSRRNIVVHVDTPVEFRLHPRDVPLHVEHVLEGRSMQEQLCFVSPILQHPFSRVHRIVPSCPGEIYVRCQIYTDMTCRVVVLPSYFTGGQLPGFSASSAATSTTAALLGMKQTSSPVSSPKRYKGQVVDGAKTFSPSSSTAHTGGARVLHSGSCLGDGNPGEFVFTVPPPLHSSFHGVAEIHSNMPLYSPHASSIGSIGEASDSMSCYSHSSAIDSDDGTVLTRSGSGSTSSTPHKAAALSRRGGAGGRGAALFSFPDEAETPPRSCDTGDEDEQHPQHYVIPWYPNLTSPMSKSSPSRLSLGKGGGFAYYDAEDDEGSSGSGDGMSPTELQDQDCLAGTVLVEDFRFQPTHLTIEQGSSVRFVSVSHASVHKLSCNSSSGSSRNSPQSSPEKSAGSAIAPEFENRTLESNSNCHSEFVHLFKKLGTFVVVNEIFSFMSCEINVVVRAVRQESVAEQNRQSCFPELQQEPEQARDKGNHVNDTLYYLAHGNFDDFSNKCNVCPTLSTSPAGKFHIFAADANEDVSSDSDSSSSFASSVSTENIENESSSFNIKRHQQLLVKLDDSSVLYSLKGMNLDQAGEMKKVANTSTSSKKLPDGGAGCDVRGSGEAPLLLGEAAKEQEKRLFYAHLEGRSLPSSSLRGAPSLYSSSAPPTTVTATSTVTTSSISTSTSTSPLACQIPMMGSFVPAPGSVSAAIAAAGSLGSLKHLLSLKKSSKGNGLVQQNTISAGADFTEDLDDSEGLSSDDESPIRSEYLREIELKLEDLDRAKERTRLLDTETMPPPEWPKGWSPLCRTQSAAQRLSEEVALRQPLLSNDSKLSCDGAEGGNDVEESTTTVIDSSTKVISDKALQRRRLKNQRKKKNARLRGQSQDMEEEDDDDEQGKVAVSAGESAAEEVLICAQSNNLDCTEKEAVDNVVVSASGGRDTPLAANPTYSLLPVTSLSSSSPASISLVAEREEAAVWEEYRPELNEEFKVFKKKSSRREKKQPPAEESPAHQHGDELHKKQLDPDTEVATLSQMEEEIGQLKEQQHVMEQSKKVQQPKKQQLKDQHTMDQQWKNNELKEQQLKEQEMKDKNKQELEEAEKAEIRQNEKMLLRQEVKQHEKEVKLKLKREQKAKLRQEKEKLKREKEQQDRLLKEQQQEQEKEVVSTMRVVQEPLPADDDEKEQLQEQQEKTEEALLRHQQEDQQRRWALQQHWEQHQLWEQQRWQQQQWELHQWELHQSWVLHNQQLALQQQIAQKQMELQLQLGREQGHASEQPQEESEQQHCEGDHLLSAVPSQGNSTRSASGEPISDSTSVTSSDRLMQLLHSAAATQSGGADSVGYNDDDEARASIAVPDKVKKKKKSAKLKRYESYPDMPVQKQVEREMEVFFTQRMEALDLIASEQEKDTLPSGRRVPVVRL